MGSVDLLPPIISNYTRNMAVGTVDVAQVEATDQVRVYATDNDGPGPVVEVGTRVGPGFVNLDLSAFVEWLVENFANSISVWAVWYEATAPHLESLPSNMMSMPRVDPNLTFTNISISPLGALTFTVAGFGSASDSYIVEAITASNNAQAVGIFTGNGTKVCTPFPPIFIALDPNQSYCFVLLGFLSDGSEIYPNLPAFRYTVTGPPWCRPRQAPGLEEKNP